tara:strand:- start:959 stop:1807 length:849 start_codon:yes stop_codon:yes gene_type:complete
MKIGEYNIYSIETSEFGLDGGAMYGIIPKPLWEKHSPSDKLNRIDMVTRSLLLCNNERKILIDTGNGTKWNKKYRDIYKINNERFDIEKSLNKYGIQSNEITDVINTHLHFDHAGGNTKLDENKIVPTFPNAKYWITKDNWDLANHPSQKDSGSFLDEDWKVLEENSMIEIIDGKESFISGIDTILTYGHTKGLLHPIISDGSKTIFFGSDIFPLASHIPVPWVMAYDINPVKTMEEKQSILSKMHEEEWILFFEHDPLIQACTIQLCDKHYSMKKMVVISE